MTTDELRAKFEAFLFEEGWLAENDTVDYGRPDIGRMWASYRAALEAVAPMMASARVPERTSDMTKFADGLGWVVRLSDVPEYTKRLIEQTRDLLAAAPKPETEKARVTSQMRATACDAYDKEMVGHGETANPVAMRAALEAVAPMLASARVPDFTAFVSILREAAEILSAIEPGKEPANMRWPIADELSGFAYTLAAAPKPETEE